MPERSKGWLRQAESDLRHARHALEDGDHDWAACVPARVAAAYRRVSMCSTS
jgi:HEPN domain-containing protein